ncbi:MAG: MBG domain-containing protein, partial [Patescibacteria group bacterium]
TDLADITAVDAVCTIVGYDVTYDATAHTAKGSCLGVEGETLAGIDLTSTTHIAAGSYPTDPWTFTAPNNNYLNDLGTVANSIAQADASCSVSGFSGNYDGLPHGATGTCEGVGGDGTLPGLDLGLTFTDVPGGNAHWVFTDTTGNYNDDVGDVAITITEAPSTVTVDCTAGAPYTYTGVAQTPCTASATGVGIVSPIDVTGSLVYGNNVHVGNATADASWDGDVNHFGDTGSGGFVIGQAALTVTASSASVLQGAAMPLFTPSYSGFVNGEVAGVLDTAPTCSASVADTSTPGSYPTNCVGGTDNDYSFGYVSGTLHVFSLDSVFNGLFNPLKISIKDFQKGSTIPVKFSLNGGFGNFFGGDARLMVNDATLNPVTPVWVPVVSSGGSNVGNLFRYDAAAGQYIFNLSTKMTLFKAAHVYDFKVTINGIDQVAIQQAAIKLQK